MGVVVVAALILCVPAGVAIGLLVVGLIHLRCDLCGGEYSLGHLDEHFSTYCTPETRRIWNR